MLVLVSFVEILSQAVNAFQAMNYLQKCGGNVALTCQLQSMVEHVLVDALLLLKLFAYLLYV